MTDRKGLAEELAALHESARGCEFDLVPEDGPIARLALFMHEHGDTIASILRSHERMREALEAMVHRWTAADQNWRQAAAEEPALRNTALAALSGFPIEQARTALQETDNGNAGVTEAADALTEALQVVREARLQLEYLNEKWRTGTTPAVVARMDAFIAQHEGEAK